MSNDDGSSSDDQSIERADLSQFESTRARKLSAKTVKMYDLRLTRIRKWWAATQGLVADRIDDIVIESIDGDKLKAFIASESMHTSGKRAGTMKSTSGTESYRNALMYYYRSHDLIVPKYIDVDIAEFMKGHRRDIADARRDGTYATTEGKDVLEFEGFSRICKATMKDKYIEGHLFYILCWNMTCRADSTQHVNLRSISWTQDCMTVSIPKDKTHQQGANRGPAQTLAIYANPLQPELCVVLSLGIKILCTTMLQANTSLFRSTEKEKFSDWLATYLVDYSDHLESVSGLKCDATSYGTQSVRKGSLSYLMSFPGAASAIAGLLRAGYSLGGVLPRYVRQMLAGDQSVGRTVCGLSPQSVDFSLLPPRFASVEAVNFGEFVCDLQTYPANFSLVIAHCVASVVHHTDWLVANLPADHPLFLSRYWRGSYFSKLRSSVLPPVRMHCPVTNMRATGVQVLTSILDQVTNLAEARQPSTMETEFAKLSTTLVQSFAALTAEVRSTVSSALQSVAPPSHTLPPPLILNQAVTSDYIYPTTKVSMRLIHEMWYNGDAHKRIPPLRDVKAKVLQPKLQRYVSYARGCIEKINAYLPTTYHSDVLNQDALFRAACISLCDELILCGHPSNKEELLKRLISNDYSSVYTNDLAYVRKAQL